MSTKGKDDVTSGFNWQNPRLQDSSADDALRGKTFHKALIESKIMPSMKAGQQSAPTLLRLCKPVLEHIQSSTIEKSGVMQGLVQDVTEACELVLALSDAGQSYDGSCIEQIMNSKGSSSTRALLRDIVLMTPYWAKLEQQIKVFKAAKASFLPEMQEALGEVALMDVQQLSKVAKRVPVWTDALPAGAASCVLRFGAYRQKTHRDTHRNNIKRTST